MKEDIPAVLIVGSCGVGSVEVLKILAREKIMAEIIFFDEVGIIEKTVWEKVLFVTHKDPIPMDIKLFSSKTKKNFEPHYRKKRVRRKKR